MHDGIHDPLGHAHAHSHGRFSRGQRNTNGVGWRFALGTLFLFLATFLLELAKCIIFIADRI